MGKFDPGHCVNGQHGLVSAKKQWGVYLNMSSIRADRGQGSSQISASGCRRLSFFLGPHDRRRLWTSAGAHKGLAAAELASSKQNGLFRPDLINGVTQHFRHNNAGAVATQRLNAGIALTVHPQGEMKHARPASMIL